MAAEEMGMSNTRKEEEKCIQRKEWQEDSFPQKKKKNTQKKTEKSKKEEGEGYASTVRYCHKSHNSGQ